MSKPEKLSVVVITFNEEKNLGRCLDSLKGIADDVVVVDSFSNDKTPEIAIEHGARLVQHAFEGHIEQKNWAITQAKYQFILSLDADEALSDELRASILEAKHDKKFDGYTMNRLTNYCGKWIKHCGWYPDRKLRLWDSQMGRWGGINPHDCYEMNSKASVTHLNGDIFHFSYYTLDDHYKQVEKFTDIASQALFNKGKKASILRLIISPIAKFIAMYIIRLGFLDGGKGFTICRISARATYTKYAKLRKLHNK